MCSFSFAVEIDERINEILTRKLCHSPCCTWNLNSCETFGYMYTLLKRRRLLTRRKMIRVILFLKRLVSIPSRLSHRCVSKWSSYASSWRRRLFSMWRLFARAPLWHKSAMLEAMCQHLDLGLLWKTLATITKSCINN